MPSTSEEGWRKSSYSVTSDCVEVCFIGDLVAVRDSKDRLGRARLRQAKALDRDRSIALMEAAARKLVAGG